MGSASREDARQLGVVVLVVAICTEALREGSARCRRRSRSSPAAPAWPAAATPDEDVAGYLGGEGRDAPQRLGLLVLGARAQPLLSSVYETAS